MKRSSLQLLCALAAAALVACRGDDDDDSTPTAATTVTTTAQPGASPTVTSLAATASATAPPDGTVAPQNPGAKDPVTTKSNPDPLTAQALLKDVRMGVHPESGGWERIVFEFQGGLPPADVRYVSSESNADPGSR